MSNLVKYRYLVDGEKLSDSEEERHYLDEDEEVYKPWSRGLLLIK